MVATTESGRGPLDFNHAMIYSRDVSRALASYRDRLGLTLLEEFRAGDVVVYARKYFEVRGLNKFCKKLEAAGAKFSKPPAMMPWGWKHAYLNDPDGHEISLYWAGSKRLKKGKPAKR